MTGSFDLGVQTPFIESLQSDIRAASEVTALADVWQDFRESTAGILSGKKLPTVQTEEWRYVPLTFLHDRPRRLTEANPEGLGQRQIEPMRLSDAIQLRGPDWGRDLLRRHFSIPSDCRGSDSTAFVDINRLVTLNPWVLNIEAGEDRAISWTWRGSGDPAVIASGILLVDIAPRARVELRENFGFELGSSLVETTIHVGESASLEWLRVQRVDRDAISFMAPSLKLEKNATGRVVQLLFGGRIGRENLRVDLCGERAEVELDGLYVSKGEQITDSHTNVVHRVGHTTSRQLYKGIVTDQARGVFNGRVEIARGAKGSNSSQLNRNLILSKRAEVDTKPELMIDNDDVKASHGASVGRLDAEQLFYFESRGLNRNQAVDLLSFGFAAEVPGELRSAGLKAGALDELASGLAGLQWEIA